MSHVSPLSFEPGTPDQHTEGHVPGSEEGQGGSSGQMSEMSTAVGNLLSEHKGKLAVGAAAMLGLAVFYKWREGRLAKEDPEQYARLKRIKSAVLGSENKNDEDG